MGLSTDYLFDLEAYDNEATSVVSVKDLLALCDVIGISVHEVLHGPEFSPPARLTTFEQVAATLRGIVDGGEAVEDLSDRLGWEISTYLDTPEALYEITIDGLQDICDPIGIYWPEVVQYAALRLTK